MRNIWIVLSLLSLVSFLALRSSRQTVISLVKHGKGIRIAETSRAILISSSHNNSSSPSDVAKSSAITTSNTLPLPTLTTRKIHDFERQPGVVVVTKIHGPENIPQLLQMHCLFGAAYNWKMQYDVLVFHTEPISLRNQTALANVVAPAKLTLASDLPAPSLHRYLMQHLNTAQRQHLLQRCQDVHSIHNFTWRTRCTDGKFTMPLAYNWQCEFRAKHLWTHEALKPYHTMLWLDSDAMCGKAWTVDPVAQMIRNKLVLMWDHFPQGFATGADVQDRIQRSFDHRTLCNVTIVDGHFNPYFGNCWVDTKIGGVHGFLHITNLDFYRSAPVQKWVNIFIGDTKFYRIYDDQMAVTVPAAILAPNQSWDMRSHDINLQVLHNGYIDGHTKWKGGFFKMYWRREGRFVFPEAAAKCDITDGGRR